MAHGIAPVVLFALVEVVLWARRLTPAEDAVAPVDVAEPVAVAPEAGESIDEQVVAPEPVESTSTSTRESTRSSTREFTRLRDAS